MRGNVAKAAAGPVCSRRSASACREPGGASRAFAPPAGAAITFLDGPGCACCGLPFAVALEGENLCAACLAKPPAFDRARAILAYDENSRGADPGAEACRPAGPGAGICPLAGPQRARRCWTQRSDRAGAAASVAALAAALQPGGGTGAARWPRDWQPGRAVCALDRSRATPSQGAMAIRQGAAPQCASAPSRFPIPRGWRAGASCWWTMSLTTGATVEACARALKRAGAARCMFWPWRAL